MTNDPLEPTKKTLKAWDESRSDYETQVPGFTSIIHERPDIGETVEYLAVIWGKESESRVGWWTGKYSDGGALVMDYGDVDDDWEPCTHWRQSDAE